MFRLSCLLCDGLIIGYLSCFWSHVKCSRIVYHCVR